MKLILALAFGLFVSCAAPQAQVRSSSATPHHNPRATPLTAAEIAAANIGDQPDVVTARFAAQCALQISLKDPWSAVVIWTPTVERSWFERFPSNFIDPNARPGSVEVAWIFRATVSSKNGYGAYDGQHQYGFYFRNGMLVAFGMTSPPDSICVDPTEVDNPTVLPAPRPDLVDAIKANIWNGLPGLPQK